MNLLKKYSIGNSLLNKCPIWLQRWAALTIYFIDLERQLLPIMLYKAEERERDLKKNSQLKHSGKNKDKKSKKKRGKSKKISTEKYKNQLAELKKCGFVNEEKNGSKFEFFVEDIPFLGLNPFFSDRSIHSLALIKIYLAFGAARTIPVFTASLGI